MKKMKINYMFVIIAVFLIAFSIYVVSNTTVAGVLDQEGTGCCELVCKGIKEGDCDGPYHSKPCHEVSECNVGCCVDSEGYCFGNYLKGNCLKNNYTFVEEHECDFHFACLYTPEDSLVGFTGLNVNKYEDIASIAVSYANSKSYKLGDIYSLRYMAPFAKGSEVKLNIKYGNYNKVIDLYDDGLNNDGNANDGLFGADWDSSNFPDFNGIKNVPYSVIVNGEQIEQNFQLTLSSGLCSPLVGLYNESNDNIIFVIASDANEFETYKEVTDQIIYTLYAKERNIINDYNFLIVNTPLGLNQISFVKDFVLTSACPGIHNPSNDLIFFIDKNYEYCRKEDKVFHITPLFFPNQDMPRATVNDLLTNYCDYIMPEKELSNLMNPSPINANVVFSSPSSNQNYNTNDVDVTFTITHDSDDDLEFEIIQNGLSIYLGYSAKNQNFNRKFNFNSGDHEVWVEIDLGNSYYMSNIISFTVD
jgi:hypothetical protein